jgi:hypothetical protein
MKKIKAKIYTQKIGKTESLWLIIDYPNKPESVSFPIIEEEIEPIKEACEKYLKSQT